MVLYHLGAVLVNKIYQEYDFFAYFYNKYWMAESPKIFQSVLEMLLFQYVKKGSSILDVCCGTGHIADIMFKAGYKVSGIDGSVLMLEYAAENAPQCQFYHYDARDFQINEKYSAVTCLFDSINHILLEEDLYKVFQNIYNHLKDDGIFLFDVNSLESCINVFMGDITAVEENTVFISKGSYNETSELITYNLTAFIKEDNCYKRQESQIIERYYNEKLLISLLKKAGFKNIKLTYGSDIGIEELEDRIFFTLWK